MIRSVCIWKSPLPRGAVRWLSMAVGLPAEARHAVAAKLAGAPILLHLRGGGNSISRVFASMLIGVSTA
ncbi:MAG: hypothetical protein MUC77_03945 [Chromatiaceae bacterium]|nr:hypothetical protein [Chromatiaceae bacterium]